MEKSANYNFNLPNSANDEIADINDISDNFRIIDEKFKIDQTFSGTSENPQSGKAVAEAIQIVKTDKQDKFAGVSHPDPDGNVTLLTIDTPELNVYNSNHTSSLAMNYNGVELTNVRGLTKLNVNQNNINCSNFSGAIPVLGVATPVAAADSSKNITELDLPYQAANKQYVEDTTNNVKSYVNNNFANALKGSASGEAVRLTDVSPLEHTLTVKLKSKNLLPFPYFHSSMLQAGITYTVNSAGTITANGTATGRSEFVLSVNKSDWASGNYVLSGCPSGGSKDTYFLQTINGFSDTGSGIKVNNTAELKRISITIIKGTTVSNLVFKPQLELGTTPTAYTPYITDFSGVTLKRCGRNLVDISDGNSAASASTVDITESCPRGINIFGSAYLERSVNQPCRLRIDYVVDGETNYLFGEMMYSSGICTVKGTIPISATQVNLTFQKLINGEGYIYWKNVQLEIGDSATDYRAFQQQNYIANADGTVPGVTGISDDITLITDTDGVTVNAEYNKDINKVISELYALVNG